MSTKTDFLLGRVFSLLTQLRQRMIKSEDVEGVELVEDEYQVIKQGLTEIYQSKEK